MTNLRIGWFLGVAISAISGCAGTDDSIIDYQQNAGLVGAQTNLDDKNYSVEAEYSPSPDRLKPLLSTLADISEHAFD